MTKTIAICIIVVIILVGAYFAKLAYLTSNFNAANLTEAQQTKLVNKKWPKTSEMVAYEKINTLCANNQFDEAVKEFDKIKTKTLIIGPKSITNLDADELALYSCIRSYPFGGETRKCVRSISEEAIETAKNGDKKRAVKLAGFALSYSERILASKPLTFSIYLSGESAYLISWKNLVKVIETLGDKENKKEADIILNQLMALSKTISNKMMGDFEILMNRKPTFLNPTLKADDMEEKKTRKYIDTWNAKIKELKCAELLARISK